MKDDDINDLLIMKQQIIMALQGRAKKYEEAGDKLSLTAYCSYQQAIEIVDDVFNMKKWVKENEEST